MMLVGISVPRFTQCYWDSEPDPPGVYRVPYSFDKTWAEVSPLKARELSEAEAWFYRGDLMLHIGRLGEAEAYLRRSIQQPPQVSRTHAAVGLLHLQQKRYREASESLKLALELEPNNYLAHYYHVVLTELRAFEANESVSYDDLEDMHDELLKILAITPEFSDAAEMLARINGVRQTAAAESIKVLIDAIKRYPGRSSAWIALAGAAVRGGDAAGARSVLNRLLAAGATDAESRRTVATLLQAIEPGETRTLVATPVAAGTQQGAVRATSVTRPNARSATPVRGDKLSGLLTLIECKNGLTLSVKTGGKTVKLRTNSAFSVEFIARDREGRATTSDPIVCGPTREDGIEVSVTYRASRSGDSIGEPLIVEIRLED
jgi:tetratricopeptide (TPR) repeat protein